MTTDVVATLKRNSKMLADLPVTVPLTLLNSPPMKPTMLNETSSPNASPSAAATTS